MIFKEKFKLDHKKRHLYEAMGISEKRTMELSKIIVDIFVNFPANSMVVEEILNNDDFTPLEKVLSIHIMVKLSNLPFHVLLAAVASAKDTGGTMMFTPHGIVIYKQKEGGKKDARTKNNRRTSEERDN